MTCSLSWSVACGDGLLLITHHTMILVIIAVLMTDTINTLTRTTDTVVTVVREKLINIYDASYSLSIFPKVDSLVAVDPQSSTTKLGVCEQLICSVTVEYFMMTCSIPIIICRS